MAQRREAERERARAGTLQEQVLAAEAAEAARDERHAALESEVRAGARSCFVFDAIYRRGHKLRNGSY